MDLATVSIAKNPMTENARLSIRLPEDGVARLQGGDRGQAAEEDLNQLEQALESLESFKDFENELETAASYVDNAAG